MADTVVAGPDLKWRIFFKLNGRTKTAVSYDKVTREVVFDWDTISGVAMDEANDGFYLANVLLAAKDA